MKKLNHTSHLLASTIGRQLRVIRERRQMSQRDVASLSGVTQHQISRLEGGHATPTVETIVAVCRACGTCPSQVFAEVVEALRDVSHEHAGFVEDVCRM
jgi:transcriptional regulator with XRE-family HTH domain